MKHALDLFSSILAAVFFILLAVLTLNLTQSQYLGSEVISSYMDWPTWLSTVFVPIGTLLTILRLCLNAVAHANVITTGHEPTWFAKLGQPSHAVSTGE